MLLSNYALFDVTDILHKPPMLLSAANPGLSSHNGIAVA
jgi:hypothetical protein